jgi:hypothetical protein
MPNLRAGRASGAGSYLQRVAGAALALAILAGACASEPPPPAKTAAAATPAPGAAPIAPAAPAVKLLSAADARSVELAAISVTSLDRLLTNGATLVAKAVPLPIDPAGLRDMLLGQAGLSPEISANLDLGAPSGAAVVATGTGGGTGAVMAVAAHGSAEAARVLTLLGKVVEKRGDVALIENGTGGRGWLLRDGAIIVFSDDIEALSRGARLAEEARHAVAEDVTAVLYPDAIARANGTDVKTALSGILAQAEAAQAAQVPGGSRQLESFEEMIALMGDAEAVEIGLAVDTGKGLSLRGRLRARPGSKLEAVARDVRPYELDQTLLAVGKTPPAIVGASSVGGFMRGQMARQRDRLAASKEKGAAAALAFHDAMIAALGGQTAFAVSLVKDAPLFSGQLAYPLKDAATAVALGTALVKLDKDAAVALLDAQVGKIPFFDWTVKRESVGKLKTLHYGLVFKKDSGLDPTFLNKLFGRVLDVYLTVSGTRLITTFGRDAKANLGKLAAAKPVAPAGALAETLAATKGRDSFYHFDLGPVLTLVASVMKDKSAKGAKADKGDKQVVSELAKGGGGPIPIYGSAGGDGAGRLWSVDLTIPPTAFIDGGGIIRDIMRAKAASESSASDEKDTPSQANKANNKGKKTRE